MTETRSLSTHSVETENKAGVHYVTLRAITPNVVDAYGSLWNPRCFDASLERRLPTLLWGHNWQEPIGRAVSFATSNDGPQIKFRFDDFDSVPRARQGFEQTSSGTLDDVSVGFSNSRRRRPTSAELDRFPGVLEFIEEADLDEVSLVVVGAVPGAKVLSVRDRRPPAAREPSFAAMAELRSGMNARGGSRRQHASSVTVRQALAEADAALDSILDRR